MPTDLPVGEPAGSLRTFPAADRTELGYRVVGDGPLVITALHSLALDGSWFLPMAAALGPRFTVILPDLRGHGSSGVGAASISLSAFAADVVELWDRLGIGSSAVLGISMGGMVAQALAAAVPERVDALVLIATVRSFGAEARAGSAARAEAARTPGGLAAMEPEMLRRWFSDGADGDQALRARAGEQFRGADPELHACCLEAMTDVGSQDLSALTAPVLVLAGRADISTPIVATEALAAAIPGARLEVVDGGHLTAFTHPDEVAARVADFLVADAVLTPGES